MSSQETTAPSRTKGRRSRLVLAGGLALAAIVAASSVLLLGAGDEDLVTALSPASPAASSEADESIGPESEAVEDVVEVLQALPVTTYEVFLSRDPFDPVVPEPVETSGGETGGSLDPLDPDAPALPPIVPGDPNAPACTGQEELICNGQVVTLKDVAKSIDDQPVAVVQIDTTIYEVEQGQRFAENYQALLIDGSCVTLLYGDEGFRICTGDVVLK